MRTVPIPPEKLESLWEMICRRTEVDGECWRWTGVAGPNGYGKVKTKLGGVQRTYYVHRVAYVYHFGEMRDGLVPDHLCRNRWCVFPGHLDAVTYRENILRGFGATALNAAKTHCDSGHEFTAENTRIYQQNGGWGRACRQCATIRTKRRTLALWKQKVAALEAELNS